MRSSHCLAQVGESHPDHQNWGRPEADSHTPRTVYTISPSAPGADAAAAAAAALAAAAVALSQHTGSCDSELRQQCLEHARALFAFARAYPGCYSVSVPECANTYTSDGFAQYMFLGAAWLAMATREAAFEEEAALWQGRADTKAYWMAYGWDWVYIGACAVMWGLSRLERCASSVPGTCLEVREKRLAFIVVVLIVVYSRIRRSATVPLRIWSTINYVVDDSPHEIQYLLTLHKELFPLSRVT